MNAGARIWGSPTVSGGTIYLGTDVGLTAITNNGPTSSNLWTIAAAVANAPSVGPDGTIYFGDRSQNVNLNALRPDGSLKWALPLQPGFQEKIIFQSAPAVGKDGTTYFVAGGQLWAVAPSGVIEWQHAVDDSPGSYPLSPALARDGTVYVGSYLRQTFYSFRSDGTLNWSSGLIQGSGESPAVGGDGTVYISAGTLYAFGRDGTKLWSDTAGANSPPVIGADGTVYVSAYGSHTLSAVTTAGQVSWQALGFSSRSANTSPALDAAGNVYYCLSNSVWALSARGQIIWSVRAPPPAPGVDGALTSPAIGPDGTIYAALGTTLFAIASGTNAAANSAWPMYQQNPRHTGKIENPSLTPQKRSDAGFELELYGQLGQSYTIEGSTNLNTWTSVTSFVATTLPTEVVDSSASNSAAKFYRATSSP